MEHTLRESPPIAAEINLNRVGQYINGIGTDFNRVVLGDPNRVVVRKYKIHS